ncbi:hypothetical protein J6590_108775 [Homalodisca vitripennis]|nr:hypothetical protein J6590_108775 [Homalodisca vitripennis]
MLPPRLPDVDCEMSSINITPAHVCNIIRSMKNKKSSGIDSINIITIKKNIDIFVPLLCHIFNLSLQTGAFPAKLKTAVVIPVHKAGDKQEILNYRPISLLSCLSKILETHVKNNLMEYFMNNKLFSQNQFGFIPGKGTDLAIYQHVSEITKGIEKNQFIVGVYLDLARAFDFVDPYILVEKFKGYGLKGILLKWLASFSCDRRQVVRINGTMSNDCDLKYGIAQGGVLGPLMFVVYINDLLKLRIHSNIYSFADDTAIVCTGCSFDVLKFRLQKDLDSISHWLANNKLLINVNKTKCINFSYRKLASTDVLKLICHKHSCVYCCKCDTIELVTNIKYLGLIIDSKLKWDLNIQSLNTKLRKINYLLYFTKKYIKSEYLKMLYISWFESSLRYGIVHWGGTYPTILMPLQLMQRFAVRNVCDMTRYESVSHMFMEIGILNLQQLYVFSVLMFTVKNREMFENKVFLRNTRASVTNTLAMPFYKREISRKQLNYKLLEIFNKYSNVLNVVRGGTLSILKRTIKAMVCNA